MNKKILAVIIILSLAGVGLIGSAAIIGSKMSSAEKNTPPDAISPSATVESTYLRGSAGENDELTESSDPTVLTKQYIPEESLDSEPENGETLKQGKVSEDFRGFWDNYENFIKLNSKILNDSGHPKYNEINREYSEYVKKAAKYESSEDLTEEEIQYMTAAQARITAEYASAWLS